MKDKTLVTKTTTYSLFPSNHAAGEAIIMVLTPIVVMIVFLIICG